MLQKVIANIKARYLQSKQHKKNVEMRKELIDIVRSCFSVRGITISDEDISYVFIDVWTAFKLLRSSHQTYVTSETRGICANACNIMCSDYFFSLYNPNSMLASQYAVYGDDSFYSKNPSGTRLIISSILSELSKSWPHTTGDTIYPVPKYAELEDYAWEGKHLTMRLSLLQHMLMKIEELQLQNVKYDKRGDALC